MKKDLDRKLRANFVEINHMPSKKWNKNYANLSTDEGGAILMDKADHLKTRTFGGRNRNLPKTRVR